MVDTPELFGPGSGSHYNIDVLTGVYGPLPEPKPWDPESLRLLDHYGLSRARIKPFEHQVTGVDFVVKHPYALLADEMGAGKTKTTIDAACYMFTAGLLDRVIVVAPAAVRRVWFDPELGELAKHLWNNVTTEVTEFHARARTWFWMDGKAKSLPPGPRFQWIITNYDYVRTKNNLMSAMRFADGGRTLLILDESWAVKNATALQSKACLQLRGRCARVLLLNGTPITNSPKDMFSQGRIMSDSILQCRYMTHFLSRYAKMGGYTVRGRPVQIVAWTNLEDLQKRFAPYVRRKLKSECMDLPAKQDPVILTATLTPETWAIYREMRDEMVAWLKDGNVSVAEQTITKILRLSQITSGLLGGIEPEVAEQEYIETDRPNFIEMMSADASAPVVPLMTIDGVSYIGREKLDVFLQWLGQRLAEDPNYKMLAWCNYRPEITRLIDVIKYTFPQVSTGKIWGIKNAADKKERDASINLLMPETMPAGPVVVAGTRSSGGAGLTMVGAKGVMHVSSDNKLKDRKQANDRPHRHGQVHNVWYGDIVAEGPKGQKTIDHHIIKALWANDDLASKTVSAWIDDLLEE